LLIGNLAQYDLTALGVKVFFRLGPRPTASEVRINPTHGSGWIIQMVSTRNLKSRGWNPTNGSWWIVQILSKGSEVSTHCHGWDYIEFGRVSRKDLKEPPTAVGGITFEFGRAG